MRGTCVVVIVVAVVQSLLLAYNMMLPWGGQLVLNLLLSCIIAAITFGVGLGIAGFVEPKRIEGKELDSESEPESLRTRLRIRKVLGVLAGAILAELLVVGMGPKVLYVPVILELSYYAVLILAGIALVLWCEAAGHVSVLIATLILLFSAFVEVGIFLADPSNRFQYGPEIVIFASSQFVSKMDMLPLDAVVMYSTWRIASASVRRRAASATRRAVTSL